jgi:hypothetical protein
MLLITIFYVSRYNLLSVNFHFLNSLKKSMPKTLQARSETDYLCPLFTEGQRSQRPTQE